MKIAIIGSGYVGLTTGSCLANLGHHVICVDIDKEKITRLQQGDMPFYEPGLKELVQKNSLSGRLFFTANIEEGIRFAEAIFTCVGTPSLKSGAADVEAVFAVSKNVARFAQGYKILINKSTVPPGTAKKCYEIIKENNPSSEVEVVSNPEFEKEGNAVYDFNHPDKIVIGAQSERAFQVMKRVYHGLLKTYIPLLEMDWETSEMVKYANNAFLATKISFINEIANICEKVGADIKTVARAIGTDYRIGPKFLNAGVGYGGSCFSKDVRALIQVAEENEYEAMLLKEVDRVNERQKRILLKKIKERFNNNLAGKTITIWGLSYKPKTSDIREAPSLVLILELLQLGAKIKVYDPIAVDQVKTMFNNKLHPCSAINESVSGSSAIILVTEWDEFRNVNLAELGTEMIERVMFDGRNIYEPELVKGEGFEYFGIGRKL